MKIGFVIDGGLSSPDGVQQNVITLGAWLRSQGHEVHYLVGGEPTLNIPNTHALARSVSVRFNGNVLSIPLPAHKKQIQTLLDELELDIVHIQTPYSPLLAGRVIRAAYAKSSIVGTFHILAYSKLVHMANCILGFLNQGTSKYFSTHLAVSEPAAQFAKEAYGYTCTVLPNPFELQRFAGSSTIATSPNTDEVQIIFLGRLVPRKGAIELLKAMNYLQSTRADLPPYRVKIGGKGGELATIQKYVESSGLADRVEFVGFVDEADKASFLAQADLAVFPSTSGESFGISLLEGMAAARGVVVAGDNPGYRSVMSPAFWDQLVEPKDTVAFADLIAKWMVASRERRERAKKQKAFVQKFDVNAVGAELLDHYTKALQKLKKKA